MSYTPYLSAIAEALIKRVKPHITDARARDALEACVRSIAGMGATLERITADDAAALIVPNSPSPVPVPMMVSDPPENLAANDETVDQIAAGEQWLASQPWVGHDQGTETAKQMLKWECDLNGKKVAWMRGIESQEVIPDGDLVRLQIDREALERYFQRTQCSDARISAFRQTVGGRSRQTAVFTLEGTALPRQLVVQRDHPASITPEGVALQFPVLELLATTKLKVSRPLLVETNRDIIGAPFMVLEVANGSIAGADYFQPPRVPELALELAEQLAILHSVSPSTMLGTLRTSCDPRGWEMELNALEATWKKLAHAPSLAISAALAWMRAHVDRIGGDLAIIHNDAAFHNILIEDGHFSSLLDFELVHLGHPAEDLGYCRQFVQEIAPWNDFVEARASLPAAPLDRLNPDRRLREGEGMRTETGIDLEHGARAPPCA